ncbi:MAG: sialate O-acetylesterase [Phycisphaerae bacterium]|jgi:alpha-galactosidase|nr:sialate O-acetylesterase [Phycisphaerae bacterium]
MKKTFLFSLLVVLTLVTASNHVEAKEEKKASSNGKLKVFILAGQSNMQGFGFISEGKDGDLDYAAKTDFKYLKDASGKWVERKDVFYYHKGKDSAKACTLSVDNVKKVYRRHPSIGPELTFGHVLGEHFEDEVLLIKCAWGGQAIAATFRPPSSGPMADGSSPEHMGIKYKAVLAETKDVLGNLKKYFPAMKSKEYEIAGFFWHQGWNDGCNKEFVKEYEANMVNFVKDMRKDLKRPNLPFIIATSGMGGKGGAVAVPQLKAAKKLDNCYAVDTIRFRGNRVGRQISHWYNCANSYCKIGHFSAKAMIAAVAGKKPSADTVGHVDPDSPNPADTKMKRKK